jgi:mono/diheme cytochrome c family protein
MSGGSEAPVGTETRERDDVSAALDRWKLYHLPEGSEIFPARWLAAMNDKTTGKPFLEDLERFGLLADEQGPEIKGAEKTWKLPVGLTLTTPPNTSLEMIGVNCAACHVGELRVGAKVVRVDGAPNLFNLDRFYERLFESVKETLHDRKELLAFLDRLRRTDPDRDEFSTLFKRLREGLLDNDPLSGAVVARAEAILDGTTESIQERIALLGAAHSGRIEAAVKSIVDHDRGFVDRFKARFPGIELFDNLRDRFSRRLPDSGPLAQVLARVGDDRLLFLEARLAFLKRLKSLHDAPEGEKTLVPGPGRIDAIINARDLVFPEDAINPNSAVSFPPIWGLRQINWFHYDGDTNSLFERNMAQAMGLGAVVIKETGESTILPRNVHELEILNGRLEPPSWEKTIGLTDDDHRLAETGKTLYQQRCANCHDFKPGDDRPLLPVEKRPFGFPVYDIGTDPQRLLNFGRPMKDGREFAGVLAETLGMIKRKLYETNHVSSYEQTMMEPAGKVRWLNTQGYVARPLRGIWATAPYLHNGSVPTIDDLLKPSAQRPAKFLVGHREYDPAKLGYVSDPERIPDEIEPRLFLFDTSLVGNRNTGHEPNPPLTDDERQAIIAYLKTL